MLVSMVGTATERASKTAKNSSLSAAKSAKQDEFYTEIADIERELRHYRKHFEGKIVYLNCDDPRVSSFFHYFSYNFETLKLKKLIATCYRSQTHDRFSDSTSDQAVYLEYEGDKNGSGVPDLTEIGVRPLKGDGDFRSDESIELLKQADIVVTNPPISLFKEYMAQVMEYGKKFIVLGSQNAITYKEIFGHIRAGEFWLGHNSGEMAFRVPEHYTPRPHRFWIDEHGQKWRSFGNMCWFTNLDHSKRHEELILFRNYTSEFYPTYDNYDAIEVAKIADIPVDYDGVMGVTPGFLARHNPDQFEIVGTTESNDPDNDFRTRLYSAAECRAAYQSRFGKPGVYDLNASGVVNGEKKYKRVLIRRKGAAS